MVIYHYICNTYPDGVLYIDMRVTSCYNHGGAGFGLPSSVMSCPVPVVEVIRVRIRPRSRVYWPPCPRSAMYILWV